jgi:hypothetical protein
MAAGVLVVAPGEGIIIRVEVTTAGANTGINTIIFSGTGFMISESSGIHRS